MMEEKRLKKDLPFGPDGYTSKGTVITLTNMGYSVTLEDIEFVYNNSEAEVIKKLWNDPEWFEDTAIISRIGD